jgi:diguanylate cyclase (GGDEF)-like protein
LRLADILFRYGNDEFVALLNETNPDAASLVGRRIRAAIRENPVRLDGETALRVDVSVTSVSAPRDGHSLSELIGMARQQVESTVENSPGSTIH